MSQAVGNPFAYFLDRSGFPLSGGKVYIGEGGQDPEINPIDTFFDDELTVAATQPINVIGGIMARDGNPARVFVEEAQYSIRVRDADGAEVFYIASAVLGAEQFQPINENLTAISELLTTSYGRALLGITTPAALRNYAGLVDSLPLSGGTVTGDIKRQGAGGYGYMASSSYPLGFRILPTANGAADPRTQIGDIWLEEEA